MLFTFTNKAALELKERVHKMIGEQASFITVGTYHSICCRILRRFCGKIGYEKNFSIYDSEDSMNLIKSITKDTGVDEKALANFISRCKDNMLSPLKALEVAQNAVEESYIEYYKQYQFKLFSSNSMDFDDLILNTIKLFKANPDVLLTINKKYQYITADESHDSSPRDIELIKLLGGASKNICMIFDDDQSIYGFRGSDVTYLFKFKEECNPKTFFTRTKL